MAAYEHRGDKNAMRLYDESYQKVTEISTLGSDVRTEIERLDQLNESLQTNFNRSDQEVINLEKQLKAAKAKRSEVEQEITETRELRSEKTRLQQSIKEQFLEAKNERNNLKKEYLDSIPTPKRTEIRTDEMKGPSHNQLTVHSLGDVHGWAPGLTSFLLRHDLAQITVNGINLSKHASRVYPDIVELARKGRQIEGQWMDGSPFTPLHPKFRKERYRGAFGDVLLQPSKGLKDSIFIQVGDLNDRGDYSELNFDIMRKFCLSSGGRAFALIGNHEEMLMRGNYKNWLNNEDQSGFFESLQKPGSFRMRHEFVGGIKEEQVIEYRQSLFFSYCAHFAHMLLTQEYVLRSILDPASSERLRRLTQPALDVAGITDDKLKTIAHSDEWSTVELCYAWLEKVWKADRNLTIPGAITVCSIGHFLGLHASVNALAKFLEGDRSRTFKRPYTTKQGAKIRLHLYTFNPKKQSEDADLLWERDAKSWSASKPSQKMTETVQTIQRHLPHVTQVVQGHEPLTSATLDTKTHRFTTPSATIAVSNIDVGMTPVYLPAKLEDKYNLERVPKGLKFKTLGRDPTLWGTEFQCTAGLMVQRQVELVTSPYKVEIWSTRPRKKVIGHILRDDKHQYQLTLTDPDLKFGWMEKGRPVLTDRAGLSGKSSANLTIYSVRKSWWGGLSSRYLGGIGLSKPRTFDATSDPILRHSKQEEKAAEKRRQEEAAAKAAAEKKRREEAAEKKRREEAAEKKRRENAPQTTRRGTVHPKDESVIQSEKTQQKTIKPQKQTLDVGSGSRGVPQSKDAPTSSSHESNPTPSNNKNGSRAEPPRETKANNEQRGGKGSSSKDAGAEQRQIPTPRGTPTPSTKAILLIATPIPAAKFDGLYQFIEANTNHIQSGMYFEKKFKLKREHMTKFQNMFKRGRVAKSNFEDAVSSMFRENKNALKIVPKDEFDRSTEKEKSRMIPMSEIGSERAMGRFFDILRNMEGQQ